ncbi:MAG: hypothetical protein GY702_07570 [Desulfobulbaceae bacterium]|nr:hypothetical protein [Desulfobulbaceae bacterium]
MEHIDGFLLVSAIFYGGFISSLTFNIFGLYSLFAGPIITGLIHLSLFFTLVIKLPEKVNTKLKKLLAFVIIGVVIFLLNAVLLVTTGRITDFAA